MTWSRNSPTSTLANVRPGSWIDADDGAEITFQPGEVILSGDHNQKVDPDWWLKFIKERLSRDAPVPANPKDREVILFRVVKELFGNSPSPEEAATFYSDKSPNALDNLATLLSKRSWIKSSTGSIKSGETKFRVLAEDPDAATKTRIAANPGRYNLGDNIRLVVTRRPRGQRILNEASLVWYPEGKDSVALNISLPDGYNTWTAAWLPDSTLLWVSEKGFIRKFDFDNPAEMTKTRIGPDEIGSVPKKIRDAITKVLDNSDIPVQQPGPPAAQRP